MQGRYKKRTKITQFISITVQCRVHLSSHPLRLQLQNRLQNAPQVGDIMISFLTTVKSSTSTNNASSSCCSLTPQYGPMIRSNNCSSTSFSSIVLLSMVTICTNSCHPSSAPPAYLHLHLHLSTCTSSAPAQHLHICTAQPLHLCNCNCTSCICTSTSAPHAQVTIIRTRPIVDQWDIWEQIGMPLWLDHVRLVMVELHACHS